MIGTMSWVSFTKYNNIYYCQDKIFNRVVEIEGSRGGKKK